MTLDDLHFLLTPTGQQHLQEISRVPITPQNHLNLVMQLRQQLTPPQAQAVLETALLRQLATSKFSRAAAMYFTRSALEQATTEIVSIYRANRFVERSTAHNGRHLVDLGCGIGGDALSLAANAAVTGVDWDDVRLAMAQENCRAYGVSDRFRPLQADLLALSPFAADGLFFDPARRDEQGRRFHSVTQYQPPLSLIDSWRDKVPAVAVKISPGVDYAELPPEAEVEFISVAGAVKEAVLWYGVLRRGAARTATLLVQSQSPADTPLTVHQLNSESPESDVPATPPQQFLYEPDGAVIRAHLVKHLAQQLNAAQIDDQIAYLTAETAVATPFARCFTIEASFPFQLKRLRHYLRERNVGDVIVKKRGSPLEPETVRRQLRLRGDEKRIIFLTHVLGEPFVLVGEEESVQ